MNKDQVQSILLNELKFSPETIKKLQAFHDELLNYNKNYNLIANSTIDDIWSRHILDSAQIIKYIDFNDNESLSDIGSGAGFPGMIIAIFNSNHSFHVKLYEKSKVKCDFLLLIKNKLSINCDIYDDYYQYHNIDANYITFRAFKKLGEIMKISREIVKVNHKLIILKGKNAVNELNNLQPKVNYKYELQSSITDQESKIIIMDVKN